MQSSTAVASATPRTEPAALSTQSAPAAAASIDAAFMAQHEFEFEGKRAVFVPHAAGDATGLVVAMSTHNFGTRYFCMQSLLKTQRASLLFVTDPANSYYLERDAGASFSRLLAPYVRRFGCQSVSLFGSSMAGYGALYHGAALNTNIIASNPQVGYDATREHAWSDLRLTMSKVHDWIDLTEHLPQVLEDSVMYVTHGDYPMDVANAALLRNLSLARARLFLHKLTDPTHGFYYRDQAQVFNVHELVTMARKQVMLRP